MNPNMEIEDDTYALVQDIIDPFVIRDKCDTHSGDVISIDTFSVGVNLGCSQNVSIDCDGDLVSDLHYRVRLNLDIKKINLSYEPHITYDTKHNMRNTHESRWGVLIKDVGYSCLHEAFVDYMFDNNFNVRQLVLDKIKSVKSLSYKNLKDIDEILYSSQHLMVIWENKTQISEDLLEAQIRKACWAIITDDEIELLKLVPSSYIDDVLDDAFRSYNRYLVECDSTKNMYKPFYQKVYKKVLMDMMD